MIARIFDMTAQWLFTTSQKLHLTYNEMNIVVYYMMVPLTWLIMLDAIIGSWPWLTVAWVAACMVVMIVHRKNFEQWCDSVFQRSVDFLLWFRRVGWNYTLASVVICVAVPLLIYAILTILLIIL